MDLGTTFQKSRAVSQSGKAKVLVANRFGVETNSPVLDLYFHVIAAVQQSDTHLGRLAVPTNVVQTFLDHSVDGNFGLFRQTRKRQVGAEVNAYH